MKWEKAFGWVYLHFWMQHLRIIDWLKQGQNCHNMQMCVSKLQFGIQKGTN
jgi:hypothetical protein